MLQFSPTFKACFPNSFRSFLDEIASLELGYEREGVVLPVLLSNQLQRWCRGVDCRTCPFCRSFHQMTGWQICQFDRKCPNDTSTIETIHHWCQVNTYKKLLIFTRNENSYRKGFFLRLNISYKYIKRWNEQFQGQSNIRKIYVIMYINLRTCVQFN